jgi:hypothetical protein
VVVAGGSGRENGGPRQGDPQLLAGWRVDPAGVYPFRYHNGTCWTDVVLLFDGRIRRRRVST